MLVAHHDAPATGGDGGDGGEQGNHGGDRNVAVEERCLTADDLFVEVARGSHDAVSTDGRGRL